MAATMQTLVPSTKGNIDIRDEGWIPGSGRSLQWGAWPPTPVFLPGESHEQRSLVGYAPQGYKESDATEATQHTHTLRVIYGRSTLIRMNANMDECIRTY